MMRPHFYLSLMCAAVVLLPGCYTYTTVHEQLPPVIKIPGNVSRLAIADRCRFYEYDSERKGAIHNVGRTYNYGVLECLNAAEDAFVADSLFDTVCVPYGIELKGSGTRTVAPAPMEWSEVEKICRKSHTDALVVLEKFNLVYDRSLPFGTGSGTRPAFYNTANMNRLAGYERIDMTEPGSLQAHPQFSPTVPDTFPDGSIIPHDYPVIIYPPSSPPKGTVTAETYWRIYQPSTHTVFGETEQRSFLMCSLWRDPDDPYTWRPTPPELYYRAADSLGQRYANMIYPSWRAKSRFYFAGGSRALRKGAKYAADDNWRAAASFWRPVAEKNSGKKAARACFNMAVAAEKQGSVTLAADWLKKAKALGLRQADDYLADLSNVLASDK